MSQIQFTTVDRILANLNRDLKGLDTNESDIIEWIGEALDFLQMPEVQEECVAFIKVENYEADLPEGFQMLLQMSKYNKEPDNELKSLEDRDQCIMEDVDEEFDFSEDCDTPGGCNQRYDVLDFLMGNIDTSYKAYFDMQWQYIHWTANDYYKENFVPVRLSNNTLFSTLVCKEKDHHTSCYSSPYEYTIAGTSCKKLRFSFENGYVAMSYVKTAVDKETGYPLVPDNIRHITAIGYYVKWKVAEVQAWNRREGFAGLAAGAEQHWLKYVKQAKNYTKMPKSIDQFQNLLEQSHYLIPRHDRYYKYFGNLGRAENRRFNNPNGR